MSTIPVKVKKLHPHAWLPRRASRQAAGWDLYSVANVTIRPTNRATVPTGIALQIPDGYEGQIRPRSGLAAKHGLTVINTPGTIDSDYRGEVFIPLVNLGDQPVEIMQGDRIAQIVFHELPEVILLEADELDQTDRGTGGIGSTGSR